MSVLHSVALAAVLCLGACAAGEGFEPSQEQADLSEVIELRFPDAPTAIELDAASRAAGSAQSIAYGHCDEPQTDDDGTININCSAKWSEVAWFSISKDQAQRLMTEGNSSLGFQVAVKGSTNENESLRFSVHAVDEDGERRKLVSEPNLGDGDIASVPLDDSEFYVYMARGKNSFLLWNNGTIEFELTTSAQ